MDSFSDKISKLRIISEGRRREQPEHKRHGNPLGISVRTVVTVITGTALMMLAAKAQIPFWPVPMTLHTMAVTVFLLGDLVKIGIVAACSIAIPASLARLRDKGE